MENAVTTPTGTTLTRTATLVVVGSPARLAEAAEIVRTFDDVGALRVALISTATEPGPAVQENQDLIFIAGLRPEYVDNAIAAVRLSSLPTVVWWRGGPAEGLNGVASLADRVILDAEDPWPLWERVGSLVDRTAFTDLRWTRLTRWRSAMAHFFDLAEVRAAASSFSALEIAGTDRDRGILVAGWLDASLGWKGRVIPAFSDGETLQPLESVRLSGDGVQLMLRQTQNTLCLDTIAEIGGHVLASRVVSAGSDRPTDLLAEEARIRSRDLAFEGALERALALRR